MAQTDSHHRRDCCCYGFFCALPPLRFAIVVGGCILCIELVEDESGEVAVALVGTLRTAEEIEGIEEMVDSFGG